MEKHREDLDYDHGLENSRNKFNFGKLADRKLNSNIWDNIENLSMNESIHQINQSVI